MEDKKKGCKRGRRTLAILSVVALLCIASCLWACQTSKQATGNTNNAASSSQENTAATDKSESTLTADTIKMMQGAEKQSAAMEFYAPKVTTLEDGTQIQKTPADPYLWNTGILGGDNRGCLADGCHSDLLATNQLLPMTHPVLWNPYNIDPSIKFCYMCHSKALFFQDSMHALHSTPAFKGDCNSCHYISPSTGEYLMWDLVKYDTAFMGITSVPNATIDFSFTQDSITPTDQLFYYWENGDHRGVTPDNDTSVEVYKNWEIEVTGLVNNAFTFKLSEYEDQFVTKVAKMDCQTNPPGGAYIANVEITGLPLSVILEKAGVKAEANTMSPISDDGWCYKAPMNFVEANAKDILIITKINGEPLNMISGYPCQLWYSVLGGTQNIKRLATLDFSAQPTEPKVYAGFTNPKTGAMFNKPNTGIFNYANGTIFELGTPIKFEGYADAFDITVAAIEFSFDKGKTWTTCNLGTTDVTKWINWSFNYTPEKAGSYLLKVRAIASDGTVSTDPSQLFFNVK